VTLLLRILNALRAVANIVLLAASLIIAVVTALST